MNPRNMGFEVAGGREHMVGEDQLEYTPCAATFYPDEHQQVVVAVRWTLTPAERERVAAGEDLLLRMPNKLVPHELLLLTDAFATGAT